MWKMIVILACKFINKVSKLLGHEGSVIGGHYALKLDKNISTRISALAMAGMIFVTSMTGCKKENNNNNNNNPIISTTQPVDNNETKNNEIINKVNKTREEIKNLFNTMNQDIHVDETIHE